MLSLTVKTLLGELVPLQVDPRLGLKELYKQFSAVDPERFVEHSLIFFRWNQEDQGSEEKENSYEFSLEELKNGDMIGVLQVPVCDLQEEIKLSTSLQYRLSAHPSRVCPVFLRFHVENALVQPPIFSDSYQTVVILYCPETQRFSSDYVFSGQTFHSVRDPRWDVSIKKTLAMGGFTNSGVLVHFKEHMLQHFQYLWIKDYR